MARQLEAAPWPATMEAPTRAALLRAVARAHRRGELAAVGMLQYVAPGRHTVQVLCLRPLSAPPRWRKPVGLAAVVVVCLGALAAAGWWAASALAMPAILAGSVAVGGLALVRLARRAPSQGGGCTTTITVTHRHHG